MLKSEARHFAWLTAIATLTAITGFIVVHRAILARLRTTRLVCRETHCANRGYQDRKQDFEMILHNLTVACDHRESQLKRNIRGLRFVHRRQRAVLLAAMH
jgi:hypothetical protein